MRKTAPCVILVFLLGLFLAANLAAEPWPNLEKTLNSWQGKKEVLILSDSKDPLAPGELLPLIETFLKHSFAVSTGTEESASAAGLLVELRGTEQQQTLIVLKRASDNAIIALERVAGNNKPAVSSLPISQRTQQPQPEPARQHAPILLNDTPVSFVWLGGSSGSSGNLALLSDAGVSLYRLQGKQLQKLSVIAPPKDGLRPLTLSQGDIDGDGSFELAAVWAEDVSSVYDGTDSNIWSQLFAFKQQELTSLGLQAGYVRLLPSLSAVQLRGTYSPFAGPVKQLQYRLGQVSTGQSLPWGEQNIFALTPFTDGSGLAWLKPGNLSMLSLKTGELLPGGSLLENFGVYQSAQLAVRLENPEYRSGFEKEDKVTETYTSLPARLARQGDDSMLTIFRGRKSGIFLLGQPDGEDSLVRVKKNGGELILEYPFAPVKSFIIDFAIMPEQDSSAVLLLLNDKEDASGRAFLLYQYSN